MTEKNNQKKKKMRKDRKNILLKKKPTWPMNSKKIPFHTHQINKINGLVK